MNKDEQSGSSPLLLPRRSHITVATIKRLTVALVAFSVPAAIFLSIADEVREGEAIAFDGFLLNAVRDSAGPFWDQFFVIVTDLGGVLGVTVLTAVATALLYGFRHRREAALLLFGVAGAALINLLLKALYQRARPDLWVDLVTETSYSFPSGHAMASGALAFSLMVVFWMSRWRWYVVALGGIYMLIIGLSRMYLGVHYPSDVLAGWAVSLVWVLVVKYIIDRFSRSL